MFKLYPIIPLYRNQKRKEVIKKSKLNNVTYFASGFVDIIELIAFVRHGILRKVPRILCNKMLRLDTFNSTLRLSLNDYLQSGKG